MTAFENYMFYACKSLISVTIPSDVKTIGNWDDPEKGIAISEQLGSDPECGPFATVLKFASLMLAVMTDECNIYTRLWYVHG